MIFKSRAPLEENIYVDEQRTRMSTRWALWFQDVAKRVSGYFDELYTTKITTDTNDLTINCGTDKTLVLSHVVTDDVYPSSVTVGVGGTAPSFTAYSGNLKAYEFTGGTSNKELIIGWQLNHSYQEASSITPHIHVHFTSGAGDATKTIIFDFEYEWVSIGTTGAVATTTISATHTIAANSTVYKNEIIAFPAIIGTGQKISSILMARLVRRQDTDSFTSSVWLKSADIHIFQDTMGSRQALVK